MIKRRHICRRHGLEKCDVGCERGKVGTVSTHRCQDPFGSYVPFRARILEATELYSKPRLWPAPRGDHLSPSPS